MRKLLLYFVFIALLALFESGTSEMTDGWMAETNNSNISNFDISNLEEIPELNDTTVNNTLHEHPLFVLDCYAQWCEPCKDLSATLYDLSDKLKGQVVFGMIDIENNIETAERYNIHLYPTLLFFKNGTLVDSQIGFGSKSELIMRLKIIEPRLNISNLMPDMEEALLIGPRPNYRPPEEPEELGPLGENTSNSFLKNGSISAQ